MEGLDDYQRIKNAEAAEEREEIRQEQAREYERSLAEDRARQEKLERERIEQIAEEERRIKEEQDKTRRLQELAASLPEEPPNGESNVATVRARLPDGRKSLPEVSMLLKQPSKQTRIIE
ncbi:unnamed protein product [Gongylonema pulchrum]|uniref:UBX domain-containing protein n=1 Tax=Gongylonema pulchrum TaxID=637853 RepID=A0A183E5C3_9BILA|nr:unnamed protein product [Gongylonema pulchrum]